MPTHSEAVRLNLEFYRKQAKALLKAAQAGDASALERIRRQSSRAEAPALHDAQLTVAREQGFPSWPRFKTFIAQSGLDFQALVAEFVRTALTAANRAEDLLGRHPGLTSAGFYPALVLGDLEAVEGLLDRNPDAIRSKSGPENWEPLLYVCYSRFASPASKRSGALVETAKALLRRGANPNATYNPEEWPDNPLSCLYGAAGLNNNPALTTVLLDAGANPNDGESLYHSLEHRDLACTRVLLAHRAEIVGNTLKHMLDHERIEGLRMLLDAGADPNTQNARGETALHWAIWRGRSEEVVRMLLDAGADVNARRHDGRTPYALALQDGRAEIIRLLEQRGADTNVSALDRFMAAQGRERDALLEEAKAAARANPETARLLPDMTISGNAQAVRALLDAGVPVDTRGENGGTALHWACWKGNEEIVKLLLERGASLTINDTAFHAPPSGWFDHGAENCHDSQGDYVKVGRLLMRAGAKFSTRSEPTGRPEVDEFLREHGLFKA